MKIAVITGASSGMGKEFVRQLEEAERFDEIWLIARRKDRMEELAGELHTKARVIPLDLTDSNSIRKYGILLDAAKPEVAVLVNAAGFGIFHKFTDCKPEDIYGMIDLNDKALVGMTYTSLPYMRAGGRIINLASASAFQPVPYINVYAATKAFVLSFSRALNVELQDRGISVLAVCPFWTKTEFFDRARDDDTISYYSHYYTAEEVVTRALEDLARGKDVSVCGAAVRGQRLLVKLLPHRTVMKIWCRQQKK